LLLCPFGLRLRQSTQSLYIVYPIFLHPPKPGCIFAVCSEPFQKPYIHGITIDDAFQMEGRFFSTAICKTHLLINSFSSEWRLFSLLMHFLGVPPFLT